MDLKVWRLDEVVRIQMSPHVGGIGVAKHVLSYPVMFIRLLTDLFVQTEPL